MQIYPGNNEREFNREFYNVSEEATRERRFIAFLIDAAVILFVFLMNRHLGEVFYFLYILFKDANPFFNGQSIGKKIMGIKAVNAHYIPLYEDMKTCVLRNITLLIPVFNIFDALYIFGSEQKRFGDVISHSKVIYV